MGEADLLQVAVYQDDKRVAWIRIHREHVNKLASENGLTSFFEDSLCYYTCTDGPVLLIWGVQNERTKVLGLTFVLEELKPESAMRKAWETHKSRVLTRKDIHGAIIQVTNQMLH